MSKKNANLLVDAYCDLIEAKMPIVGKSQRRYMDELRRIATNYMRQNNYQANLEDLYGMYGTPDSVARKLAAIMTDPENNDFDVSRITCHDEHPAENNSTPRIRGCKRLTPAQAHELMQKLAHGEEITPEYLDQYEDADLSDISKEIDKHCNCQNNDCGGDNDDANTNIDDAMAEMAAAFEEANAMADAGADVAEIALHTRIPTTALYLGGFGNPADDMADYIIPVRFVMQGFVKVKATSVNDAIMTANTYINDIPAPANATLVPDTMAICTEDDMVSLFTDRFRQNKLKFEPADTELVSPLIDRDEMLDNADPNLIMDTILNIMGIETGNTDCLCDCKDCECEPKTTCQWTATGDADDEDADATVELSIECDGKCQDCGVPESFGSCPIIEKCANHPENEQVTLHITVPCDNDCADCPIPGFLGECPVIDFDDNGTFDDGNDVDDAQDAENVEMDVDEYDDCFWDEIEELVSPED